MLVRSQDCKSFRSATIRDLSLDAGGPAWLREFSIVFTWMSGAGGESLPSAKVPGRSGYLLGCRLELACHGTEATALTCAARLQCAHPMLLYSTLIFPAFAMAPKSARSALTKASVSTCVVMRGEGLFAQRLMDRGVQSLDDIVRCSLGRHQGIPGHPRDR